MLGFRGHRKLLLQKNNKTSLSLTLLVPMLAACGGGGGGAPAPSGQSRTAMVVTNPVDTSSARTFTGADEVSGQFARSDIVAFAELGDFIDVGSVGIDILDIEGSASFHGTNNADTRAVFNAHAPADLESAYSQTVVGNTNAVIPASSVNGATIIVVPSGATYNFDTLLATGSNRDDVVILLAAGNQGEPAPFASSTDHYQDNIGENIFFVGGYIDSGNVPASIEARSAKPGAFTGSYITGDYVGATDSGTTHRGTSFAVQEVAAKLAVLYEALNEQGTWSLKDAMALLMSTRDRGTYAPDLTKLLIKNSDGTVYEDENGATYLLSDAELRSMIRPTAFSEYGAFELFEALSSDPELVPDADIIQTSDTTGDPIGDFLPIEPDNGML